MLLLLTANLGACQSEEEKRDSHMANARTLEQQGNATAAREAAQEAAKLDPKSEEALLLLGRNYIKEDKPEEAAATFAKALELNPASVAALTGAARSALLANDLDKAAEYADKAGNAGGDPRELAVIRGAILMKQRKYAEAVPELEKALEKDPSHEESIVGLASAYISTGERDKAGTLLKESLEKQPSSSAMLTLLLTMALQDNDLAAAEGYVQRLLTLRPEDPALVLQLSDMRILADKPEEGLSVLTDFLQKRPAEDSIRIRLAELNADEGQFDRALVILDEAPAQNGRIRLARAGVLGSAGRIDDAENALRELSTDPAAKEHLAEARQGLVEIYLSTGRSDDAEKELSRILEDDSGNVFALFWRGRVNTDLGNSAKAIQDLSKLVELDPSDSEAALALSEAYVVARDADKAESVIADAIKRDPKYGPAYSAMASLYMMQNKPEAALMSLNIGKLELPDDPNIIMLEANILASQKRYDEAVEQLEKLAEREAYTTLALRQLANVYGAAGKHDQAVTVYDRLLAADPDLSIAADGRIQALIAGKKEREALAFAEKRQQERPQDPEAAYLAGEAARANKDIKKAEAAFLRALELAPGWSQPLTLLAQYYIATNNIDKAIELARTSMANAPEAADNAIILAMLLEEKGDLDAAEETYRSVLANEPGESLASNNLAFLLSRHKSDPKRLEEAEQLALRASATRAPQTLDTLGWIYFLRGKDEDAEKTLRAAHEAMPENPTITFHLASALAALSKDTTRPDALAKKDEAKSLLKGILDKKAEFDQQADAKKLHDSLK